MTEVLFVLLNPSSLCFTGVACRSDLKALDRFSPSWNGRMKNFTNVFSIIGALVIVVALLLVIGPYNTTFFPESAWAYAMEYNTNQHVFIASKPHDYEFFKAPIANKYCHFDRTVTTQKRDESKNYKLLV